MDMILALDRAYHPSEDVVAREIQGEFILIPITSGVVDLDDEGAIFTLNETGKAIWDKLDGKKTLKDIVDELILDFEVSLPEIEKDVLGLIKELFKRKMVVEVA